MLVFELRKTCKTCLKSLPLLKFSNQPTGLTSGQSHRKCFPHCEEKIKSKPNRRRPLGLVCLDWVQVLLTTPMLFGRNQLLPPQTKCTPLSLDTWMMSPNYFLAWIDPISEFILRSSCVVIRTKLNTPLFFDVPHALERIILPFED